MFRAALSASIHTDMCVDIDTVGTSLVTTLVNATRCYLLLAQHLGDGFVDHSGVEGLLFGCQGCINNDLLLRRNLQRHI